MVAKTLAGRWKLLSIIAVLAEFQLKFNLPFVYLESWTKLLPENNNWAKTSFRADNNFQVHYLINNGHARSRSLLSRTRNQTSDKLKSDTNYQRLRISRPRTKSTNWSFFDNLAENVQDVLQTGNALLFPVSLCTHLFSLRLSQKVTPSSNLDLISGPTEQKSDKVAIFLLACS